MKHSRNILALFVAVSWLMGCQQGRKDIDRAGTETMVNTPESKTNALNLAQLLNHSGWLGVMRQPNLRWQEADALYRKLTAAESVYRQHPKFNAFKQIAIEDVVLRAGLVERYQKTQLEQRLVTAPQDKLMAEMRMKEQYNALSFYLQEMLACKGQNPEVALALLQALRQNLGAAIVKLYAQRILRENDYRRTLLVREPMQFVEALERL